MHESERCSTRQLTRRDAALCQLSGLSSRTLCNARKKLQELKLIVCTRGQGNVYRYDVCNPETGKPWPGDPKQRALYQKKEKQSYASSEGPERSTAQPIQSAKPESRCTPDSLEKHGIHLPWGT